jgi:hypothetical protein
MRLQPHHHKYKNIILTIAGFTLAIFLAQNQTFNQFLAHLGNYGYISAFFAGMLFASTFTIAAGGLILLTLAKTLSPLELIIIGGFGAVTFDFLVFKFVKDKVNSEVTPVFEKFLHRHHFRKILHTKYFGWTLPVVGAFIIASPLPDEIGVSLLGISKMNPIYFLGISFISHLIGMSTIIASSALF